MFLLPTICSPVSCLLCAGWGLGSKLLSKEPHQFWEGRRQGVQAEGQDNSAAAHMASVDYKAFCACSAAGPGWFLPPSSSGRFGLGLWPAGEGMDWCGVIG